MGDSDALFIAAPTFNVSHFIVKYSRAVTDLRMILNVYLGA